MKARHLHPSLPAQVHTQAVVRCKVCAKRLRPGEESVEVHHGGARYRVCCPSCAAKFEAAAGAYIVEP